MPIFLKAIHAITKEFPKAFYAHPKKNRQPRGFRKPFNLGAGGFWIKGDWENGFLNPLNIDELENTSAFIKIGIISKHVHRNRFKTNFCISEKLCNMSQIIFKN
jgi:hypothetical protein